MATNYNTLIESEKNLKKMVVQFLEYSYSTHEKLWKNIFTFEDGNKIIDSMEVRLKEAEQRERDLLDECIWIISKDNPRANHLRFIISIIYTTKDITKTASYPLYIAKTFVRKKIDIIQISKIKEMTESYLKLFEKYIKIYQNDKIKDKFDEVEKMYLEFIEFSHEINKKIRAELTEEDLEIDYFPISQIIKLIEGTIEHVKNIFTNAVLK
ncbi:MAG: hypothetical protein KFW07_00845 [Mycoplasmataceae bacterium]|nr:hypothetical protein [Mycoplasmataceae bacterium]